MNLRSASRRGIPSDRPETPATERPRKTPWAWDQRKTLRTARPASPTRGGAATTLCEFAESAALGIELDEAAIPVRRDVAAACALLGLDPLYCANEGKMLAVVAPEDAEAALETLRSRPEGENAAIIGRVTAERPGKVVLRTRAGGGRILQKLSGAQLPRIC